MSPDNVQIDDRARAAYPESLFRTLGFALIQVKLQAPCREPNDVCCEATPEIQ